MGCRMLATRVRAGVRAHLIDVCNICRDSDPLRISPGLSGTSPRGMWSSSFSNSEPARSQRHGKGPEPAGTSSSPTSEGSPGELAGEREARREETTGLSTREREWGEGTRAGWKSHQTCSADGEVGEAPAGEEASRVRDDVGDKAWGGDGGGAAASGGDAGAVRRGESAATDGGLKKGEATRSVKRQEQLMNAAKREFLEGGGVLQPIGNRSWKRVMVQEREPSQVRCART